MPSLKPNVSSKNNISLDDVCYLISTIYVEDEIGQQIPQYTERLVFCSSLSVSRAEFFNAGQAGLKPSMTLLVDSDEYDKEKEVKYSDERYRIYKDYRRNDGYTEVYCEAKHV